MVSSGQDEQSAILDDNKKRCEFFRHFEYKSSEKLGSVRGNVTVSSSYYYFGSDITFPRDVHLMFSSVHASHLKAPILTLLG